METWQKIISNRNQIFFAMREWENSVTAAKYNTFDSVANKNNVPKLISI